MSVMPRALSGSRSVPVATESAAYARRAQQLDAQLVKNWLSRVSRHPTGAGIISGVIVAALTTAALWQHVIRVLTVVRGGISAAWHGLGGALSAPVILPAYHLVGWLALTAVLAYTACVIFVGLAFRYVPSWRQLVLQPAQPYLTDEDRDILKMVAEQDGDLVPVGATRARFRWSNLVTQRYIERLVLAALRAPVLLGVLVTAGGQWPGFCGRSRHG
jgi:hypothetical protein